MEKFQIIKAVADGIKFQRKIIGITYKTFHILSWHLREHGLGQIDSHIGI